WVPSVANFILVRVGRGVEVYDALLARGVIVRPMDGYAFPEYLRISIGLPEENTRCIEALAAVLRASRA
ncbi:MAG: aminotransferase class I/II-fold pyridoxal phosphate-dependent enzyme, partial [Candidatus Binatia bacterium]